LWIQEEEGHRPQHKIVEFDIRYYKKSRTVLDTYLNLQLEDLVINKDLGYLILKAKTNTVKNEFEAQSDTISWIVSLPDSQLRRTIVHSTQRFGLSSAGRRLLRTFAIQPMADDIVRVTIDGDVFDVGSSRWIRNGLFHVTVNSRAVHVIALDPRTFDISEIEADDIGDIEILRSEM
jgi:hypothetical protein